MFKAFAFHFFTNIWATRTSCSKYVFVQCKDIPLVDCLRQCSIYPNTSCQRSHVTRTHLTNVLPIQQFYSFLAKTEPQSPSLKVDVSNPREILGRALNLTTTGADLENILKQ